MEKLDVVYIGGYFDCEIDMFIDYIGYINGGLFFVYYVCMYYEMLDNLDDVCCFDLSKYYKEDIISICLIYELCFSIMMDILW